MIYFLLLLIIISNNFYASSINDSTKVYNFNEITVIGNKFENKLIDRTSAIGLIKNYQIKQFGFVDINNVLKLTSGILLTSTDGFGKNNISTIRGYYGGGEAEYISLYFNGMLLNDVENGLINWSLISGNNYEIELYKGGASSLYGDYALGGVINILPNYQDTISNRISFGIGNHGLFNSRYSFNYNYSKVYLNIFFTNENNDGFRKHSAYKDFTLGVNTNYDFGSSLFIKFINLNQITDSDLPGVISESNINSDKKSIFPYFKKDNKHEERHFFALQLKTILNSYSDLTAYMAYKFKKSNRIETFMNTAPIIEIPSFQIIGAYDTSFFGDTNEREMITNNLSSNIFMYYDFPIFNLKISVGNELDYINYKNKYYDWFFGFEEDYIKNDFKRGAINFEAKGDRLKEAVYLNLDYKVSNRVTFNLGLRYDFIRDEFEGIKPDTTFKINSNAFSPKIGINYKLNKSTSIFLNYNKSFKAPNIYQLTDLKQLDYMIFLNIAPSVIVNNMISASPFANSKLKPQIANNYELGLMHSFNTSFNHSYYLSVSCYLNKIKDEIDFDLSTYKYENITNTIHYGIELEILAKWDKLNCFGNFTYCEAKFDGGINDGKILKGLPVSFGNIGFNYNLFSDLNIGLTSSYTGKSYLSDDNLYAIGDYFIFNLFANYTFSIVKLDINIENILNKEYYIPGYLLGTEKLLYPSIGTILRGGLTVEF